MNFPLHPPEKRPESDMKADHLQQFLKANLQKQYFYFHLTVLIHGTQ